MDYAKKKLLTQSVAYMQAHLNVTPELLTSLKQHNVLTEEEASTIQKDNTPSGKVLELLCLLKRKDNRTYTRLLHVLEDHQHHNIVQLLSHKDDYTDEQSSDPRTVDYLKNVLSKTPVNQNTITDMACNLVLKQIHQDEVRRLKDKLETALQSQSRSCTSSASTSSSASDDTNPDRSTRTRPEARFGDRSCDLQKVIIQKDDIIRRREEEYVKLKNIMTKTQDELQGVLEVNNQYLRIISQLNDMQMNAAATPRIQDKDTAMLELERKLEETEQELEKLRTEFIEVNNELESKESELEKAKQREFRYKEKLGLPADASEEEVEEKIHAILEEGDMRKQEAEKIGRELKKTMQSRNMLQEKLDNLRREKEKIAFHMRQQELTIKKMQRMRGANKIVQKAECLLAAHSDDAGQTMLRLPNIRASQTKKVPSTHQYCIFCRSEYQPMKASNCRIHFKPIRAGQWICCGDDCHRSAGCLQVPHFYIEITVDKKIFLTDGARYMELA